MSEIVVTNPSDLKRVLKEAILEIDEERVMKQPEKVYSINAVSKMIGKAHATVKKLVKAGYLKTTADGLILESSISEYLQK
ncbi:MAG: hypothetical protein PHG67_13705 [Bacteroidales bacterium]|jgi:tRNA A22 N-methylase|nr:hypothetical protein [Bacteroidales bacterium]